jgi:hypothetical protein
MGMGSAGAMSGGRMLLRVLQLLVRELWVQRTHRVGGAINDCAHILDLSVPGSKAIRPCKQDGKICESCEHRVICVSLPYVEQQGFSVAAVLPEATNSSSPSTWSMVALRRFSAIILAAMDSAYSRAGSTCNPT